MSAASSQAAGPWHVAAAVCAWLVPGLGHLMLGERQRGLILLIAIGGLWLGGLLIGGLGAIDRDQHAIWFYGQALTAPSFLANWTRAGLQKEGVSPAMMEQPTTDEVRLAMADAGVAPAFGRPSEHGVLYTALAGMLNLLAILDVIHRDPDDPRYQGADRAGPAGGRGGR